ncbi:MAG: aldehyde dehydrogenase family protein [bacterium]|nr:aldehyde dehydrogenase family protein [bacterium]
MWFTNAIDHAKSFADHLESNAPAIHTVLRKYQSKEVVDDEIKRSLEALRSLSEIERYFTDIPFSQETATFLPLNLPLYSFVLFAAMPAYQSVSLTIRAPKRMQDIFTELFDTLSLGERYPNIHVFSGSRESFLVQYCKKASVILFTGKYENFLRIRKACNKDTLILFNGVGHNPLVITPSADITMAVEKTLKIKLFNNGQDCAGPDIILVHNSIADVYLESLLAKLSQVRCGTSYQDDDVLIGPLFESSSLLDAVNLISSIHRKGANIVHGGQIDINHNIMYPCVIRASLRQLQNFTELYSPLFMVTEYDHDRELALYFDEPNARYQNKEMYISLFGESDYVAGVRGSIILKDRTIHDIERGTEEYGGYSPEASSVSYRGVDIPKPLLIPREINNFLSPQGQSIFATVPQVKSNWEQQVVATQFQEAVQRIFGDQLVFAYVFGSFAIGKDMRYSDVDTLVCVHNRQAEHIEQYLDWLFTIHEMLGRIPDFKYPTEIVPFAELQAAVTRLPTLELSASKNEATKYDAMVWCHSLSQPWVGTMYPENVPEHWKQLFPAHSSRLLRLFLEDLEKVVVAGSEISQLRPETYEIPRKEPDISRFIENLSSRGLVSVLKMIPFEENPIYTDITLKLVAQRQFMGRKLFATDNPEHLYSPYFRFGVVAPIGH